MFSACIQRTIDNDKSDQGSPRAATALEFFQRFPSMLPCLLSELADAMRFGVLCDVRGWPVSVYEIKEKPAGSERDGMRRAQKGSLYPLLLLLSKLRTDPSSLHLLASVDTSPSSDSLHTSVCGALSLSASIFLFLPLIKACLSLPEHRIRDRAAAALSSLTPLYDVPQAVADVLSGTLSKTGLNNTNLIHGSMLMALRMLEGLKKTLLLITPPADANTSAETSENSDVKEGEEFAARTLRLLLPLFAELITSLSASRFLCPGIIRVLVEMLRVASSLNGRTVYLGRDSSISPSSSPNLIGISYFSLLGMARDLLIGSCRLALRFVFMEKKIGAHKILTLPPYEPWLWREAAKELVCSSVLMHLLNAEDEEVEEACTDNDDPFTAPSLSSMLQWLDHSVSELREGVLLGLEEALDELEGVGDRSAATSLVLLQIKAEDVIPDLSNDSFTQHPTSLMGILLRLACREKEVHLTISFFYYYYFILFYFYFFNVFFFSFYSASNFVHLHFFALQISSTCATICASLFFD